MQIGFKYEFFIGNLGINFGTISKAFFGAISWVFSKVTVVEKSIMTNAMIEAFSKVIAMEKSDPLV